MVGEQKRKARELLVTKALLLGYTFEWDPEDRGWFIRWPDGRRYTDQLGGTRIWGHWPAMHLAAAKALEISGVPDATKPQRDTGVGSGKSYRLRGRQRLRGSAKSLVEGAAPRRE